VLARNWEPASHQPDRGFAAEEECGRGISTGFSLKPLVSV
jgi:hypothetical protein